MLPSKTSIHPYLFLILNLVPIIVFFLYIKAYAVNVPYMDDMEFIGVINELKEDSARFPLLLVRQQNDHRSAVPRLGVLMAYWINGTLNFRVAILLGYLNLLLLGWSFFLVYKSSLKKSLWFLPVSILLFSPLIYQDHLWTITAYQHTLSIAFSLLALLFIQEKKTSIWYYAIPLSVAATLTNLDGVSLLAVVLFWLATQKRWRHFFIYFLFALLYLLVYFYDFKFSVASKFPSSLDGLSLTIQSFIALTGSIARVASDTYNIIFSLVVGTIILTTYLLLKIVPPLCGSRQDKQEKQMFHFGLVEICFMKLLVSVAIISIGRSAGGIEEMMATRFQIYSVSVLIMFYLFISEKIAGRSLTVAGCFFLLLTIALSVASYVKYDAAVKYFASCLKADTYNYPAKGVFLHQYFNLPDPEPTFYRNYAFPVFFDDDTIRNWQKGSASHSGTTDLKVVDVKNEGAYGHYLNSLLEFSVEASGFEPHTSEVYLSIFQIDNKRAPYLVALSKNNGSLYQRLKGDNSLNQWRGNIPNKLPPGTYRASLCWIEYGKPKSIALSNRLAL